MQDVFILAGVRTAIGDFGGSLASFSPAELGQRVLEEAIKRATIEASDVQHIFFGQVIQTVPKDAYLARVVGVNAGIPVSAPALTLNRLCGSGVQAIISGAQTIALGEADIVAAGGAEVMSRSPHHVTAARFGQKMGSATMTDAMIEVLSDPFDGCHMGVTAENVATRHRVDRATQDELAAESHRRAFRAQQEGRFADQILPVEVKGRKGSFMFVADEHVRPETSAKSLAQLRPAFQKDGTVTAGNASGINDGAAAVILASGAAVEGRALRPMARILGWGHAGVEPNVMGLGPVDAVPLALERAGLTLDQIDVVESNEAFAAQACAVAQLLGFDPERTNPNGSGISLGHPVGATGTILIVKAMYELERIGGRFALVTMCIGGGQGIALVIERVSSVQ